MPQFVTENNIPNAKVIAGAIIGYAIPLYLFIAPHVGLPTFDPEWAKLRLEEIITGIVSIILLVMYFKKPSAGDGIKQKE